MANIYEMISENAATHARIACLNEGLALGDMASIKLAENCAQAAATAVENYLKSESEIMAKLIEPHMAHHRL